MTRKLLAGLTAAMFLVLTAGCGEESKPVPKLQADIHAKAQPTEKAGKKNAGVNSSIH